ncbi:peptide deformylase [Erwinia endophytica]|uniref:peptide deformylase n=1 Tax=Erwinia endophytica TaxID=1563158 RepID=UPI00186B5A91|nr:peptide deformylase [Erwinia endophytica]
MTADNVLWLDDHRIKAVSRVVDVVDGETKLLVERMFAIIEATNDSGLAAIQLGVAQRIIVIDMDDDDKKHHRLALINPRIVAQSVEKMTHLELCSSIPGHPLPAERAQWVRVAFIDLDGNPQEIEAKGRFSVCLQHEMDHLDGRLLTDTLSDLKRSRIRAQLAKQRRKRAQ